MIFEESIALIQFLFWFSCSVLEKRMVSVFIYNGVKSELNEKKDSKYKYRAELNRFIALLCK